MTWLQDSEQKHAYALSTHSAEPPPPHAMQREVPISVEESAPVTSEDHTISELDCGEEFAQTNVFPNRSYSQLM
jgi:hypothetical protein